MKFSRGDLMRRNVYQIILEVANSRSYADASEKLYISSSGISQAVNKYEQEIGIRIFEKNHKGVSLTNAGAQLLPYIKRVVDAEYDLEILGKDLRSKDGGAIRIGSIGSACIALVPVLVGLLHEKYPAMTVYIEQSNYEPLIQELTDKHTELAIVSSNVVQDTMNFIPLIKDEFLLIAPLDHQLEQDTVSIEDIRGMDIITQLQDNDYDTKPVMTSLLNPQKYRANDMLTILSMVRNGLGIGLISKAALGPERAAFRTYHVNPPLYRTIGLAYLKDTTLTTNAENVIRLLSNRKILAKVQAEVEKRYEADS